MFLLFSPFTSLPLPFLMFLFPALCNSQCRKKLSDILLNEVRERKQHEIKKNDFLQILMDSVDENGTKLNEVEVMENIVSLILGGYESTSNVMTWGLYYLAKYPDVLERLKVKGQSDWYLFFSWRFFFAYIYGSSLMLLQEETRLIQKQKSNDKLLTAQDIKSMKYTSKVAEELIRLSNVSPFIFRTVAKDNVVINGKHDDFVSVDLVFSGICCFENWCVCLYHWIGYKFPKNWKVIVWIRSFHIDSRYFADPFTFNPDRWDVSMLYSSLCFLRGCMHTSI